MADIAEPLRPARILGKPKRFEPLRKFSCGRQGQKWETWINGWVGRLFRGKTEPQTVVILEDAHGKLIGVGSFRPNPLLLPEARPIANAQYVHAIAIDRLYQGKGLGNVLLEGITEHIEAICGGTLPHVWAYVSPENKQSLELFGRHGFDEIDAEGEGDAIVVRVPRPSGGGAHALWLPPSAQQGAGWPIGYPAPTY